GDRQRRMDDRRDLCRTLEAGDVPADVDAQSVLHLVDTRPGEAGATLYGSGIGRDAVDVVGLQAGVGDGGECRLAGEIKVIAEQAASDGRLRHAGDDRPAFQRLAHRDTSGSNSGSATSSLTFSNTTRSGMPICTRSRGQLMTLVMRRKLRCSTSSTSP